jgi:anti-sigma B factor antagonist
MQACLRGVRVLLVLLGLLLSATRGGAARFNFGRNFLSGGLTVALKITDRVVDGVAVEELEGRIVLGEESNALREKVKSLLAAGQTKIVLNMDNVTYIDSSGLGTLVASHTSSKALGGTLKLANLGSKFQEILQVTKLVTIFEVYPSEAAAIASFAK